MSVNKKPVTGKQTTELPQVIADKRTKKLLLISGILLLVLMCICMALGRYSVPVDQAIKIIVSKLPSVSIDPTWNDQTQVVIWNIRFPRVIAAVLVGAALSVSGASYQGLFKNSLVSPDILGVSSGACVGAAVSILLHISHAIEVFAFFGAIAAVFLTTLIPKLLRNKSSLMLVLAGVLMGGLMTSVMSFIKYIADPDGELQEIVYWTMGSLSSSKWEELVIIAPLIIVCLIIMIKLRWKLDILSLGDSEAKSLGINVKRMRIIMICCSTILTSSAVCISGTIGWIGLVIPHICRILVGQSNKNVIPLSFVIGGAFLLIVDTACRTVSSNEVPLSMFTGLIGVPLFIWLLVIQKNKYN